MRIPITVIIALLLFVIGVLFSVYWLFFARHAKKQDTSVRKDRNTILKEANRQLAQNPRDHRALLAIADLYYDEKTYEKAMTTYRILMDLSASNSDVDEFTVTMRYGLCAVQSKQYEEAYKALVVARNLQENVFEVEYNLGYLEYRRGNLERAVQLLSRARTQNPEHLATRRYLGRALYKQQKYPEALKVLRRVVDVEPTDKESLFYLAQSYYELNQSDQALAIFTHLRPDPLLGPHSALYAGTIHTNRREFEQAVLDFELGLRHEGIKQDVAVELRYRLATVYIQQQDIGKALNQLLEVQKVNPNYKDVKALVARSKELHSNSHLQTYLISSTSEFVTLCRRIVMTYHRNAKVKVTDVTVHKNDYADILTEIETAKWEDVILFRFVRGTSTVGELILRELNSRLKELRAGRGICITAADFSESARAFVEARLIDLVPKNDLLKLFNRLD